MNRQSLTAREDPLQVVLLRSNPVAPDPRVSKTAASLADAGYRVTIFCWDRLQQVLAGDNLPDVTIIRRQIRGQYASGLKNLLPLLRWQAALFAWLFSQRRQINLIHACDFDTVLPAYIISRLFHIPLVYDIFDFYSDNIRSVSRSIASIVAMLDRWVIERVDGVILADENRLEQLKPAVPKRHIVIYNTPPDSYTPGDDTPAGKFTIAYTGQLLVNRGLLELVALIGRQPDWQLNLAGFGGDTEHIMDAAKAFDNISLSGAVPYEKALRMMREAQVIYALYDPSLPNHRYASPNKLFEAMMLAKPIIAASGTGIDRLVEREGIGLVVPYGDTDALEQALIFLSQNPVQSHEMGLRARKCYENSYKWSKMECELLAFYRQVLDSRGLKVEA